VNAFFTSWISDGGPNTRFPEITAVTCSRVSVLFSMASEAWMLRMRFSRRSLGKLPELLNAPIRPTSPAISTTMASAAEVTVNGGE